MNERVWQAIPAIALALAACGSEHPEGEVAPPPSPPSEAPPDAAAVDSDEEPPPPPPEGRRVLVFEEGKTSVSTEPEARARGLAVVDLSNYWVPFIFSERDGPEEERLKNPFRPVYRKLANDWPYESRTMAEARRVVERRIERARAAKILELREKGVPEDEIKELLGLEEEEPESPDAGAPPRDEDAGALPGGGPGDAGHFLEVYGILPSLSVLRRRALEEVDRPCYEGVDLEAIRRFDGFVAYRSNEVAEEEARKGRNFARRMRDAMERLGVDDPMDLIGHPKSPLSAGLVRIAVRYEALVAAQEQLVCEDLYLPGTAEYRVRGGLDWKTHQALTAFERKNRIFAWGVLGEETLEALGRTPHERLFGAFMRVLAERIADATGIVEDGSARGPEGERAAYLDEEGREREVPNLVAEYAAVAMRHMGLGSPAAVIDFLKSRTDDELGELFVAIPLPDKPPYHSEEMDLLAEIDRGDVWYDYPFTDDGRRRAQPRKRMPELTLYVRWNDQKIPLVTMGTTIGSWRTELAPDGYEYYRYKNSDVGPRVWRDIVAGPVWMPPETTPVGDLVKTVTYRGRKVRVPNYDEFGPWYGSAYGLVAAFHVRPVERRNGDVDYLDNGIRSHGSVDYNSILRRFSHGCHRLYNHLAIRMFDFVLRNRPYTRVGSVPAGYRHGFEVDGEAFTISLDSRGYKYELVEPLPVEVLRGRVRGSQRSPIETYMPKPDTEYGPDAEFLPERFRPDGGAEEPSARTDAGAASRPAPDAGGSEHAKAPPDRPVPADAGPGA